MQNTRTTRQLQVLNKWEKKNYKGTFIAATGFGKTFTGILGIKGLIKRKNIESIIIIVPSTGLKDQWEEKLFDQHLHEICEVYVINTAAAKSNELKCDLIIYDEYHRSGSEFFGQVRSIKYKYALALTATIERTDGAHEEMLDELPIVDEVTIEECLENGWVSNYLILNLMVPFKLDDQILYETLTNDFNRAAANCTTDEAGAFENANSWVS